MFSGFCLTLLKIICIQCRLILSWSKSERSTGYLSASTKPHQNECPFIDHKRNNRSLLSLIVPWHIQMYFTCETCESLVYFLWTSRTVTQSATLVFQPSDQSTSKARVFCRKYSKSTYLSTLTAIWQGRKLDQQFPRQCRFSRDLPVLGSSHPSPRNVSKTWAMESPSSAGTSTFWWRTTPPVWWK